MDAPQRCFAVMRAAGTLGSALPKALIDGTDVLVNVISSALSRDREPDETVH
ncbi:hypothetical protein [Actinomadura rudentiformis]|uniref:hypothetical protein n=1 Tax=Actinomadura rudentiformis TaxID=359158 RepID=UPI00178C6A65|nr:hypothetical protein [Actinomadura rudentiformis]